MSFGAARLATEKAVFRPALLLSILPGITEMQMGTLTYKEQLLHPNWQRKRLEILSRDEYECVCCGDKESTLHVHHRIYIKGRKVWEYENEQLETLCHKCHSHGHELRELLDRMLASVNVDIGSVVGLVGGYLDGLVAIDASLADEAIRYGSSYDAGIMASMAEGASWDALKIAAPIVGGHHLSPAQEAAICRWRGE